ncbi:hypothetical protein BCR39DRAFT_517472 [Naematelia encephala]|uniref:Fe2OG dioxygenase domain-containing protein n=1 Tax=Naematelia encephala TaxID=71784 RepID=A0A1Y2BHM0_9TREE|nr:hypothetical protein BCR39DRAFT_517472 [Naematelia encephala]
MSSQSQPLHSLHSLADQLSNSDFDSIPIIDLSDASESGTRRQALAGHIRNACLNAGFFYVKNHSVPTETVAGAFQAARDFFDTTSEIKQSVDIGKSDNFRGYMALLTENNVPSNKGELHEAFNLGLDPSLGLAQEGGSAGELQHSENLWPSDQVWKGATGFKQAVLDYYSAVLKLGQVLFPLFALALDLDEHFFDEKTRFPAAIMRLLRYPGIPPEQRDERIPGIGPHTDFECFTILCQDAVGGLQVQNKKGEWIDAPYIPGTFVINIGDQFARWTNDIFVSTPHRVLPPTSTRYSIPYFFGCDHEVPLIPPSTCTSDERPNKYPEIMTAGAYVKSRLDETYTVSKVAA